MKNTKKEITLEMITLKQKQFWSDCNDVREKDQKREIKKRKIPEYCVHSSSTKTKQ